MRNNGTRLDSTESQDERRWIYVGWLMIIAGLVLLATFFAASIQQKNRLAMLQSQASSASSGTGDVPNSLTEALNAENGSTNGALAADTNSSQTVLK